MSGFRVDGLAIGVATAATQIEGGCATTNWADWARTPGHIADRSSPERATNHWRRWREDTELLASLGMRVYRMGVEWARLEPEPGRFDEEAFQHYRDELNLLREKGIRPLVTLHHFNNPRWFEQQGGFEHPDCVPVFLRFVQRVVTELGDLVDDWCTINEPNVYATEGFLYGRFPPGGRSLRRALRVMAALAEAHCAAYRLIHALRPGRETTVVAALHLRVFDPANPRNPAHRALTRALEHTFQVAVCDAMFTGRFPAPLRQPRGVRPGRYFDAVGVNYYSRSWVSRPADGVRPGAPVTDLGWEVYPDGIERVCRWVHRRYDAPEIWITENGTCDNGRDGDPVAERFRRRFLHDHLAALARARASGIRVERYYHWCFVDNWEWAEGEVPRFGIVALDYATQERTVKPSGRMLAEVAAEGGLSPQSAQRWLTEQDYRLGS